MQHDGLSTSMGGLWRNLDAMATTDPAGGFRTAEYTRSALIRRINLVGYRKRYFVMQLGLRLLWRFERPRRRQTERERERLPIRYHNRTLTELSLVQL